jgi:hypothetical protein
LRSAGDWSHGILKEDSIQGTPQSSDAMSKLNFPLTSFLARVEAYIELIREANHTIYIENQ